jgi:ribose transport system permease protein
MNDRPMARSFLRGRRANPVLAATIILLALAILLLLVGNALAPGFATGGNVLQLLKLSSFLGIAAIGETLVVLTGGIDLSIAWILGGAAVVFTDLCGNRNDHLVMAALVALSVGGLAGLLNGIGIAKLRISPIVMTLAMNNILQGAALVYTGGTPLGTSPSMLRALAAGSVGAVPSMVILWAVLGVVTIVLINLSRWGRALLSVGENPRASRLSGLSTDAVTIAAYVACGVSAAGAGILFVGFSGASFLGMGDQFVLPAIAAVVLGGTTISGGRGGYEGTIAAVFFVTMLTTVLSIENISPGIRSIVFGLVVIAAIVSQRLAARSDEG